MEPDIRTDPYRNNKDKIYVIATFPGHFGKSGKSENRLKKGTRRTGAYLCTNFFVIYLTIGYLPRNRGIHSRSPTADTPGMPTVDNTFVLFLHTHILFSALWCTARSSRLPPPILISDNSSTCLFYYLFFIILLFHIFSSGPSHGFSFFFGKFQEVFHCMQKCVPVFDWT